MSALQKFPSGLVDANGRVFLYADPTNIPGITYKPRNPQGLNYLGAYNPATPYVVGDAVLSANIWYHAIKASTGQTPASSPSFWQPMADDLVALCAIISALSVAGIAGVPVNLIPGDYFALSTTLANLGPRGLPDNTVIHGNGARWVYAYVTAVNSPQNALFFAFPTYITPDAGLTTALPVEGSRVIHVDCPVVAGQQIEIAWDTSGGATRARLQTFTAISVVHGADYAVTVERSIKDIYPVGSVVSILATVPHDIQLDGMTFTGGILGGGSGRFIELCNVIRGRASNLVFTEDPILGTLGPAGSVCFSWDTGSRDCVTENLECYYRLTGTNVAGVWAESNETCSYHNITCNGTVDCLPFWDCIGCTAERLRAEYCSTGPQQNSQNTRMGCIDCEMSDIEAYGCANYGALVAGASLRATMRNVVCINGGQHGCGTTGNAPVGTNKTTDTTWENVTAKLNVQIGVYVDTTAQRTYFAGKTHTADNFGSAPNGADCYIRSATIFEELVVNTSTADIAFECDAPGAGVTILAGSINNSKAASFGVQVDSGGCLDIKADVAGVSYGMLMAASTAAALVRVREGSSFSGAANSIACGATTTLRLPRSVKLTGATDFTGANCHVSHGTFASGAAVPFRNIQAGEYPRLTLVTLGGTGTGLVPSVAVTAGTGFTPTPVGGDTSTWAWEL